MSKDLKTNESQNRPSRAESETVRGGTHWPSASRFTPDDFFRLSPFALMRRMSDEVDRMFGDWGGTRGESSRTWSPAIEVSQRGGDYVVRAELPGLAPNDVKVEIAGDSICLEGERKSDRDETKEGVRMSEHRYGRFFRSIPLPEGAKLEGAKANFSNGVLEITVPVPEQTSQRRQIPIQSDGHSSNPGKAA